MIWACLGQKYLSFSEILVSGRWKLLLSLGLIWFKKRLEPFCVYFELCYSCLTLTPWEKKRGFIDKGALKVSHRVRKSLMTSKCFILAKDIIAKYMYNLLFGSS